MSAVDFANPGNYDQLSTARQVTKPAAEGAGGVVCSQNRVAAAVGADVLAKGGNAVDAAVATALACNVVEPWMSGIGGGGAMLVLKPGESAPTVVDFSMASPSRLKVEDYPLEPGAPDDDLFGWPPVLEQRNIIGPHSIAVPGSVAGYALALESLGTKSWAEMIAPSIALAEAGLVCDWFTILQIATAAVDLAKFPGSVAAFLPDGHPPTHPAPPMRIPRPELVATLKLLAAEGPRAFYEGPLAQKIAEDIQVAGGSLSAEDLAAYKAEIREPLSTPYAGAQVHSLPDLSGGPTMARALKALEGKLPAKPSAEAHAAIAAALYETFEDRLARMGDEAGRRGEACTTHISVVDRDGMLVSLTTTLLSVFGSRMALPQTGVLMNNGINWFDPRPGRPNSLAPGKRPLCNYNPTIVTKPDGKAFALGASGGRKIIGGITQLSIYLAQFGMGVEEALAYPRMDISGGPKLGFDPRFDAETIALLGEKFETVPTPLAVLPNGYSFPSITMRDGARRVGGADPIHPWCEAVAAK